MAGRRRQSPPLPLLPQPSGRHDDEEEEKEEEDGRALSLRGVVGTPSSSASSSAGMRGPNCLRQMHHLSLLSASRDLRVLLDLQYLTQAFVSDHVLPLLCRCPILSVSRWLLWCLEATSPADARPSDQLRH